ncbi:MAG: alanine--tRNA ligase-related protein, partial [Patescibacteria group bacterium]
MTASEIRQKYLDFFEAHGHTIIPSSPLVPENDPTTLFTGSGMQPLIPYLLGKNHPAGSRLANSQKCFRAMDIEEVGDNRHTTFFEMLGNWSLGDYFKEEQLGFAFEFLTKELGIPKEKLWVTCFEGDEALGLPKDTESFEIWKKLGMPEERIKFYGKKNWWSRAGGPEQMPAGEPGGPDSEIFYEFTDVPHDPKFGAVCHPNCDCGRFLEIGNSVFMQYLKNHDSSFGLLPKKNVDFGGGLERIAMVAQNNNDIFLVNHREVTRYLEHVCGKRYDESAEVTKAFRIVADHIKAAVFLIGDGVRPANVERGYVVRRLVRRAVRFCDQLRVPAGELGNLVDVIVAQYKDAYPALEEHKGNIELELVQEEERFRKTLERGMKELARFSAQGRSASGGAISGKEAF